MQSKPLISRLPNTDFAAALDAGIKAKETPDHHCNLYLSQSGRHQASARIQVCFTEFILNFDANFAPTRAGECFPGRNELPGKGSVYLNEAHQK